MKMMLRDYFRDLLSLRVWVINAVIGAVLGLVWKALRFLARRFASAVAHRRRRIHRLPPVVASATSTAHALPFDDGGTVYLKLTPSSA
jgi:hypothetical protein